MAHGLRAGWSLLTQDKRIRTQLEALELLEVYHGQIYCLSSGDLTVAARADRFHAHQVAIHHHIAWGGHGYFVVYDNEVVRRWP